MVSLLLSILIALPGPASARPPEESRSRIERPWLNRPPDTQLVQAQEESSPEDVGARIAELEAQRDGINRKWPLRGVIAGGVLMGAGVIAVSASLACGFNDDGNDNGHHHSSCSSGIQIAAAAMAGTGLILMGVSAPFLAIRSRKIRSINRNIRQLQEKRRASRSPSWGIGLDVGERKGLRIAWRY